MLVALLLVGHPGQLKVVGGSGSGEGCSWGARLGNVFRCRCVISVRMAGYSNIHGGLCIISSRLLPDISQDCFGAYISYK